MLSILDHSVSKSERYTHFWHLALYLYHRAIQYPCTLDISYEWNCSGWDTIIPDQTQYFQNDSCIHQIEL